jgi:chromate reductase
MYDGDVEAMGLPPFVEALRSAIVRADGLLLACPEYNVSVSGALKNAIDWASRRPGAPLDHEPTALLSAAGASGGARAQRHLRDVLAHNQV